VIHWAFDDMTDTKENIKSFLPDFCNSRTVFVLILVAELLAIILTLAPLSYNPINFTNLAMNSLFIQWVTLACIGVLCAFRKQFYMYNDHWVATISYGITILVTFVLAELTWWLVTMSSIDFNVPQYEHYIFLLQYEHYLFLLRVMGISAITWALALRYFYIQHQYRQQIESESEARYQVLQARIKPHFLFNCLNTIASLIRRQPEMAEQAIEDLADLFRASLQDNRDSHTLEDELTICKRYLRIEQHRLGERLQLDWQIPTLPVNIKLPALSLQPLLENAIYHGIEQLGEGGTVLFSCVVEEDHLLITIKNPVPERDNNTHHGNRLAQDNVRQRLESFFNKDNLLSVYLTDHNYTVSVIVPSPKA